MAKKPQNKSKTQLAKELVISHEKSYIRSGPKCWICKNKPIKQDIETALKLIASGEIKPIYFIAIWRWLKTNYKNYNGSINAFLHHVRKHETVLYEKCKERMK